MSGGVSSLVGKDPSIRGFADLKGKRIALPFPGSPLDFQSRALLVFEKLDPDKDVMISFGPFAQSVQRLMAGQLASQARCRLYTLEGKPARVVAASR